MQRWIWESKIQELQRYSINKQDSFMKLDSTKNLKLSFAVPYRLMKPVTGTIILMSPGISTTSLSCCVTPTD